MPTIAEQLTELVNQRNALATNLETKGVEALSTETFNTLVPKVLDIQQGSGTGTDTSDATATSADILAGKTAYSQGLKLNGTIGTYSGTTVITPSTTDVVVELNDMYCNSDITVSGDTNLIASNIKKDVVIFGVTGTLESGSQPTTQQVIFDYGDDALTNYGNKIYISKDSVIKSLNEFIVTYPDFCSSANEYALNYTYNIFGWAGTAPTCSTELIEISPNSQIIICYKSGAMQPATFRLVLSETGTAADIMANADIEGSYYDVPLTVLTTTDFITMVIDCSNVPADSYYPYWIGVSDNSRPIIRNIKVI